MEHVIYRKLGKPTVRRNPADELDFLQLYNVPKEPSRFRKASLRGQQRARNNFGGLRVETALVRDTEYRQGPQITGADDVFNLVKELSVSPDEHFFVLLLDARNRVIGIYEAAHGSVTSVEIHPRNVFRAAIVANAVSIIVVHNHPSGDPEISEEDRSLTKRLQHAGEVLGIPLLDHLVIGRGRFESFASIGVF